MESDVKLYLDELQEFIAKNIDYNDVTFNKLKIVADAITEYYNANKLKMESEPNTILFDIGYIEGCSSHYKERGTLDARRVENLNKIYKRYKKERTR